MQIVRLANYKRSLHISFKNNWKVYSHLYSVMILNIDVFLSRLYSIHFLVSCMAYKICLTIFIFKHHGKLCKN